MKKRNKHETPEQKAARIRRQAVYLLHVMGWRSWEIARAYKTTAGSIRAVIADIEKRPRGDVIL